MLLDPQQKLVAQKLQQLAFDLENQSSKIFLEKLFLTKNQFKSFYIYGDVGRGKSMLMQNFFSSLVKTAKIYFHFNSFMRLIHEGLRDIRKEEKKFSDELLEVVKRVVKKTRVICFDEFQVLDVADAMILARIFSYLFEQNIVVVFTSNIEPLQLYKNGLQREIFLEFVQQVLLKNCQVLHLNSPTDYRLQYSQNLGKRYFISNQKNRDQVKQIIANLTKSQKSKSLKLKVWGREVKVKKTFNLPYSTNDSKLVLQSSVENLKNPVKKIAIFNFDDLCKVNLAASDYQAICQSFDLIFLLKVPKLKAEDINEAKRLMLFIDEVYENKTALIVLAKTKSEKIFQEKTGFEAFKRTVSRLNEIKSDQYWQTAKFNSN